MTLRPAKSVLCALGLALLLASSAGAAHKTAAHKAKTPRPQPQQATAARSERCRGADLFPCGPVYNGNDYLGDDPDPFIRLMIKRDLGIKYGGPD